MGPGRAYRLREYFRVIIGEQATKVWDYFYGGSLPLVIPCKDFNLAIGGGLGWMEWLKSGAGKGFIFHELHELHIPALYPFW